ncbi:helix-turn-helix transcriptional regulator [Paractinoplanes brasiliensis]|uniref:Regulatory LuxR family protein n=1 Tax=Paractinoplanes brasiliensis TaxID=52695 RepID=A0A4R6JF44_9ACTN|nr:LuxR family transcriptional regulator [Actinoplanes brasiliensis]TDO33195.1 regulatory LuxR family protein [Actinoplanes brasiliensis]GID33228.1 hypothetical protein Abr02nite_82110 [Actinoplanes brasiliensis]
MTLVERAEALAVLRELTDRAVGGRGRAAVMSGAAGTGKTALLGVLAGLATEAGATVLMAGGARAEQNVSLGLLNQLFHDAPRAAGLRSRAPGEAADLAEPCGALLGLAARRPLALLVDDIQWSDQASADCLAYLARRMRQAPILLVVAGGQAPAHATGLCAELSRPPHGTRLRLSSLSADGVRYAAAGLVGPDAARRWSSRWHAWSGGNPLLLNGLLEDHAAAGFDEEPADAMAGGTYGHAVVTVLDKGDPPVAEVGRALAITGDPKDVAELLGIDAGAVARAVHFLTAAGVLAQGRFRHPAAARAVLAVPDGETLERLHHRAAVLAFRGGAAPERVADHLVRADTATEPWAVPLLENAARLALRDGKVERGIAYLRLARRVCTDERRPSLTTLQLVAEWQVNPARCTDLIAELLTAARAGRLHHHDALTLAKALLWLGRTGPAEEVLGRLPSDAVAAGQEFLVELLASRPWIRATYPAFEKLLGKPSRRNGLPAMTVPGVRRVDAATSLVRALERRPVHGAAPVGVDILRGAHVDESSLETIESGLLALVYTDHAEDAAPWCDRFLAEVTGRESPGWHAGLRAIRAEIAFRLGDLTAAADHARAALTLMPPSSWGVAVGGPLATAVQASVAMGDLDEAGRWLDQPVPEGLPGTRSAVLYLQARGRYSLVAGHHELALRDFTRCGELLTGWSFDGAGMVAWRLDLAETHIATGSLDLAVKHIEDELARANGLPRVRGMATRMLAATSAPGHRPTLLREAGNLLQHCGDRYELARTLQALAEAHEALGEFRRMATIGDRARSLADACRIPLGGALLTPAEPLAPAGERPEEPVSRLSDAERRVAALAALGHTNREIADKLFVTLSTVEQHLTKIYRKLNVSRRADLPASLVLSRAAA